MVGLEIQDPYFKPEYGAELDPDYFQQRPALFFPCNEGAGSKLHDPSDDRITGTLNGGVTWTPSALGAALKFDGVTGGADFGVPAAISTLSQITVEAIVIPLSTSRGDWVTQWSSNVAAAKFDLLQGVTTGKFDFYISTGAAAFNAGVSATTIVAGTPYHIVGTFDGATIRLYVNGRQESSSSHAVSMNATPTNDVIVGNSSDAKANGLVVRSSILPYAIAPQQVADLYANPWGMFAPRTLRMAGRSSGGLLLRRRRAAA